MDRRIKKIDINYKHHYILINNNYYIYLDDKNKNATVYNLKRCCNDSPAYIFKWMIDNHLIQK